MKERMMAKFTAQEHWKIPPVREWPHELRLLLIRLVVGKLSVVANVRFEDGTLFMLHPGIMFNCEFVRASTQQSEKGE